MSRLGRPRRPRSATSSASAIVKFSVATKDGKRTACVYVECRRSAVLVGPVWGHGVASVRAALAALRQHCGCGAAVHRGDKHEGHRLHR